MFQCIGFTYLVKKRKYGKGLRAFWFFIASSPARHLFCPARLKKFRRQYDVE